LDDDGDEKWTKSQRNSLFAVEKLVRLNGAFVFNNLEDIILFLNKIS